MDIKVGFMTTWGEGESRGHEAFPEITVPLAFLAVLIPGFGEWASTRGCDWLEIYSGGSLLAVVKVCEHTAEGRPLLGAILRPDAPKELDEAFQIYGIAYQISGDLSHYERNTSAAKW